MLRRQLFCWLVSIVFAASSGARAEEIISVQPAAVFPVEIVGSEKPLPVVLDSGASPLLVEVANPPTTPMEVFTSGPLSVEVVSTQPVECNVPRFTVVGFTSATYKGGDLAGLSGAAQKCQAQYGEGSVMCREDFVRADRRAVPRGAGLSAWIDSIASEDDLERNCSGPLLRRDDPETPPECSPDGYARVVRRRVRSLSPTSPTWEAS